MGIIIVAMIVLIVIFIVMIKILRKVFSDDVTKSTAHLSSQEAEYEAKKEEIRKQLEDAKRQSQEIIANAQKDAAQQKDGVLKAASEEKDKILGEAQAKADEVIKQADNARLALLNELELKINEGATLRAQELLQSVLPEDFRKEVHVRWVNDVIANGFSELDRLRVPEGLSEVKVVSAFGLTEKETQQLKSKLKEKLGFDVKLEESIDPSLICGLVVNVGSLILDGSLKFKIQGVARVSG
ncbi:MAG: F0F1 ATP synthase subunit delta [Candidatus Omnitrophica bacterium]|nr:F0F1 ATP synthase subunit delta [Candidatus Omnitrophota bacterium]